MTQRQVTENWRNVLQRHLILCIGGRDPSGCAGLDADVRMVNWLGGQAASLCTVATIQHRTQWQMAEPVPVHWLAGEAQCLLGDRSRPVAGVKIGAVADLAQAQWLAGLLDTLGCPSVLDPVLGSSAGGQLSSAEALHWLAQRVDLCTPNQAEAQQLFGWTPTASAWQPPTAILLTGADATDDPQIHNCLYHAGQTTRFEWPRRSGHFRGTGCLLASASCALLSSGRDLPTACLQAQQIVDLWLAAAWTYPDDRHLPQAPL